MSFALAFERVELGAHQVVVMQRAAHMLLQPLTRSVESHPAGNAVKQLGAQLLLQAQDLTVDRARGHKQVVCGLAYRATTGDLKKILQYNGMHGLSGG